MNEPRAAQQSASDTPRGYVKRVRRTHHLPPRKTQHSALRKIAFRLHLLILPALTGGISLIN